MKLSEFIAAYGDERVRFQRLDTDAHNLQYHAGKGTDVTFRCDVPLTPDGLDQMGIVMWFDRDRAKEIIGK